MKRREAKSKGEKERYKHLNAEFQRIARRDKKAFLNDQCKEIEENSRMGKTRVLFKKIRDTKGTFHAKMGSIKDRYGMCDDGGATWFFSSYGGILELRRGIQDASCVGPGKSNLISSCEGKLGIALE